MSERSKTSINCKDGEIFNPKTKKCVSLKSAIGKRLLAAQQPKKSSSPTIKTCKDGEIFNPKTKKCVSLKSAIGKRLLAAQQPKKSSSPTIKTCKDGEIFNPKTKKCVSLKSAIGKRLLAAQQPKKSSSSSSSKKLQSPHDVKISALSILKSIPEPMEDLKKSIIKHIAILRDFENMNNNYFKARAYTSVLAQLYACKTPITSYEDYLANVKAGEKINHKVKELIDTGKISYEERNINKNDLFNFQTELRNIYGIGESKIKQLLEKGIKSLDELRANTHLLNEKQKIGLMYYEDLNKRIPLDEYLKHKEILESDLIRLDLTYNFVGSFRRGSHSMGDIDILIMKDSKFNLDNYIERLKTLGYIRETLALGNVKFSGIVKIDNKSPARQVDILISPPEEYYFSLLYFTGSAEFNVGLRNYIKNKYNVSLSEHGIKEGAIKIPIMKTEADIFDFFNLKFVEPHKRKVFYNN
jgi:DNA polymerase beta